MFLRHASCNLLRPSSLGLTQGLQAASAGFSNFAAFLLSRHRGLHKQSGFLSYLRCGRNGAGVLFYWPRPSTTLDSLWQLAIYHQAL